MSKLTDEEIRPAKLMANQHVAALTDIGRLLSRYSEFVDVACPACNEKNHQPKFEKNGIRYVECRSCLTFYVTPRPPSDVLEWFYKGSVNYAYWNEFIFPASEEARREGIFVPRVDRLLELCEKYKIKTNALLEVGSGFGTFCTEVKKKGVFGRVVAVEPTPNLAETCRKRGLEVLEQPVEQINLSNADLFDVVASFEVIEHLFAPIDFIMHMHRLLKPGGMLMLTCPNGEGFDVETLGIISNTVDHEHLNYFNKSSLTKLLTKCGFEVLETNTPGRLDAELVRNKVLSGDYDISKEPFLKKILIDEWDIMGAAFQEFLINQGLSSNMWVVARKV
jgi:2-polyprenyl-3-methyl-5-hydroxy-6-metoxy-1,4-benzoquinol methylase